MKKGLLIKLFALTGIAAFASFSLPAAMAQTPISLGAANVPVLSNTTIPGVTGVALQSRVAAQSAYNQLASLNCGTTLTTTGQTVTATSGVTAVCGSSATLANGLNLSGAAGNQFVVRVPGGLTLGSGNPINLSGVNASDVFYVVDGAVTVGPNATVNGTILATGNVTVDPSATVNGRVISLNGTVTADASDVVCTGCIATSSLASLAIQKTVINDNGGTSAATDFQFFVNGLRVMPNARYVFVPGTYAVSELLIDGGEYLAGPWGGNCSATGSVVLGAGASATCTVVNDDLGGSTPVGGTPVPTSTPTTPTIPDVPSTGGGGAAGTSSLFYAVIAAIAAVGAGILTTKKVVA